MKQQTTAAESATYPHDADIALIPFKRGQSSKEGSFEVTADLVRHGGGLYGGTAAAATVMAIEAATQQDAVWVLTQFVDPAKVGERVAWVVDTLARGRYVVQLRVTATVDDRIIFMGLGSTGHPRPNGLTGQFETMPDVTPPEDSPTLRRSLRSPDLDHLHRRQNLELREAMFKSTEPPGRLALWARLTTGANLTRAGIAYLADRVPMAISRGAGRMAPGFSLDNCVRFAAIPLQTQWVLLDLHGQVASDGYGHGSFVAWAPSGVLVATGSQSATMSYLGHASAALSSASATGKASL